jgi:transposase
MSAATTRRGQYTEGPQILYLAFELSLSVWKLAFSTSTSRRPKFRNLPARDLEGLCVEIQRVKRALRLPANTPVVSCYEAGRDGFWLHRFLDGEDVHNYVVDPASVEVNRRGRSPKTDRLDVRKLLTMLIRHHQGEPRVWSTVRIPTVQDEDARHLHRSRKALREEKTRHSNRIKGLLISQGLHLERIPRDLPRWLDEARLWDGRQLALNLRRRLEREHELWLVADRQIRELETEQRKAIRESSAANVEQIRQLMMLRGIGEQSAWIFVMEFFGWRNFQNRREVGSLAGFTPPADQSGETERNRGISKAGNRHVRAIAVELAWIWLRLQPHSELTRWYNRRFAKAGPRSRKVGIVGLARRLLIALWRYLELGVIPEGAKLKA